MFAHRTRTLPPRLRKLLSQASKTGYERLPSVRMNASQNRVPPQQKLMKRTKKQSQLTELFTCNGLSEATGLDRRTVKRRLAGIEPAQIAHGLRYFRLADFRAALERSKATRKEKEQLEIRRLLAQCERIEFQLAVDRREFISSEEVATDYRHLAEGLKATLLANEDEWPPKLAGLAAPAIKVQLRILTDDFCAKMRALATNYTPEKTQQAK